MSHWQRQDFHFVLPPEQIAQYPLPERGASRLLVLDGLTGAVTDQYFTVFPTLLQRGDLLIFNTTKVVPARLFAHKTTGGRVEILIERVLDTRTAYAHLRANKPLQLNTQLWLTADDWVIICGRHNGLFLIESGTADITALMQRYGHTPLPPYIRRAANENDDERYQTVYAKHAGAVAAPTAGLHFDTALLTQLTAAGIEFGEVTLHIGAGTFQPVRVTDLMQHQMHAEWLEVTATVCAQIQRAKANGRRVIAIGTTAVRCLETAAARGELLPYRGDTQLFIYPGYSFRVVDALLTNFHLPESTLLMLVAAFAGYTPVMAAYRHAVAAGYRFFSYGDAMFITAAAEPSMPAR